MKYGSNIYSKKWWPLRVTVSSYSNRKRTPDTTFLPQYLYAFKTKLAHGSLHHNYPRHEYNDKRLDAICKSYASVQMTVKHLSHILGSLKTGVNIRCLHAEELKKGAISNFPEMSPAVVTPG